MWLEAARLLSCGYSTKIMCCASSASMMISHGTRGYSCYCFKCKASEYVPHSNRTIKDIQKHKRELAYSMLKEVQLPRDYVNNIPIELSEWIFQYGIDTETAVSWGLGYSKYYDRIVIPIYENTCEEENLLAVQMRAIHTGQVPKYINLQRKGDKTTMFWCEDLVASNTLIITEDILSAIKIHDRTGYTTVSLISSNLNAERAAILAGTYSYIYIWLDGDKAGRQGTLQAIKELKLQGVPNIYKIYSELDPKEYIKSDIEHFIKHKAIKC